MGTCAKLRRRRQGFTLVELLMVIVIIGILAGLITSAAIMARGAARRAVVKVEMSQLDTALQNYKTEYGDFPPDFANINHPTQAIANAARARVIRHLRKAFPKYTPGMAPGAPSTNAWDQFAFDLNYYYGLTLNDFDPASALVFWLGGLPENPSSSVWTPSGFHTDRNNPFRTGSPRTERFFEFAPEQLALYDAQNRPLRFYPKGIEKAPYVYFRAIRFGSTGNYEYGTDVGGGTVEPFRYVHQSGSICVPYIQSANGSAATLATERIWNNRQTYQILTAGLDNEFGDGAAANFRFSKTGLGFSPNGGDQDNLTNFADGELENQIE